LSSPHRGFGLLTASGIFHVSNTIVGPLSSRIDPGV
jgi:hypothetical protein